jgi:hypothetical protein
MIILSCSVASTALKSSTVFLLQKVPWTLKSIGPDLSSWASSKLKASRERMEYFYGRLVSLYLAMRGFWVSSSL